MWSSCEGDALILCRLLGFSVNSFDRPPQLSTVGSVVDALNEFFPLPSFVIQYRFGDLIIHCRQPGRFGILLAYVVSLLHHDQDLRWDLLRVSSSGDMIGSSLESCRSEQLLVLLAINGRMTGAQFAFYLMPISGSVSLLEVHVGSVPGRRRGVSCL